MKQENNILEIKVNYFGNNLKIKLNEDLDTHELYRNFDSIARWMQFGESNIENVYLDKVEEIGKKTLPKEVSQLESIIEDLTKERDHYMNIAQSRYDEWKEKEDRYLDKISKMKSFVNTNYSKSCISNGFLKIENSGLKAKVDKLTGENASKYNEIQEWRDLVNDLQEKNSKLTRENTTLRLLNDKSAIKDGVGDFAREWNDVINKLRINEDKIDKFVEQNDRTFLYDPNNKPFY